MTLKRAERLLKEVTEVKELGGSMEELNPLIEQLVTSLNGAAEKYYYGEPLMSDKDYDSMYDILLKIEVIAGHILPNSPTQKAGASIPDKGLSKELSKVTHVVPALSLDKTKDIPNLIMKFTKGETMVTPGYEGTLLMWKCDGMTLILTYQNGKLTSVATRGNGYVGEDVTHNSPFIKGIPMNINATGDIIVRGEAMMSYGEFNRVNSLLPEDEAPYKNPRNLVSATVRLNSDEKNARMRDREVNFFAFELTKSGSIGDDLSFYHSLNAIESLGIQTVPHILCSATDGTLEKTITDWSTDEMIQEFGYPVDGLVVALNDTIYAAEQPGTGHNPHIYSGLGLKWADKTIKTVLRDIEWSPSKTGLLNPVAIFDPVELEGTTVSRASLHNISYIMEKDLRILDEITTYKANMIIPQVDVNLSAETRDQTIKHTGLYKIADKCPVCGSTSSIHGMGTDVMTLHCNNPFCSAKQVGKFVHFCERDCMNIVGLSEKKIEFLLQNGYIQSLPDLFTMKDHNSGGGGCINKVTNQPGNLEDEPGWEMKSVDNLLNAIEKARTTDFISFMHAMSIPNVGKGQSKLLLKHLQSIYDLPEYKDCHTNGDSYDLIDFIANLVYRLDYNFSVIDGFGRVIGKSLDTWIRTYLVDPVLLRLDESDSNWEVLNLLKVLNFTNTKPDEKKSTSSVTGKTFVITGSLNNWKNRDALVADIESNGGKVSGSVSKNTDYLINNDKTSTSGKNKKAMECGTAIIDEVEIAKMLGI